MALKFGCSISELGERIPSSEWPVFIALYELEPWSEDFHSGKICSTMANMAGRTMKKTTTPSDYMVSDG